MVLISDGVDQSWYWMRSGDCCFLLLSLLVAVDLSRHLEHSYTRHLRTFIAASIFCLLNFVLKAASRCDNMLCKGDRQQCSQAIA